MSNNTTSVSDNGLIENTEDKDTLFRTPKIPQYVLDVEFGYLLVFVVIGVCGNSLIIAVQARNSQKKSTDYLIMSLAVFELFCTGFNVPFRIATVDLRDYVWDSIRSGVICKLGMPLVHMTSQASNLHLAAIAVDRMILTCFPINNLYTDRTGRTTSIVISFVCICIAVPYLFLFDLINDHCFVLNIDVAWTFDMILMGIVVVSLLIIVTSYGKITWTLRNRYRLKVKSRLGIPTKNATKYQDEPVKAQRSFTDSTAPASLSTISGGVDVEISHEVKGVTCPQDQEMAKVALPSSYLQEGRAVNRLTVICIIMSGILILTWCINWLIILPIPAKIGNILWHLAFCFPMVNCITNPILFITMSSRFREGVRKLLRDKYRQ